MAWLLRAIAIAALGAAMAVVATVERVPLDAIVPDAPSYAQLATNLGSGDGYRIDTASMPWEPEASRYPPGYPLLLAPFTWVMGVSSAAVLFGVALVVAVWWAARSIGGDVAATCAIFLLTISEPFRQSAGTVMADIPSALATVLAFHATRRGRSGLAGALVALGAWIRLAQLAVIIALRRRAWPAAAAGIALLAVSKVVLGWGYDDGQLGWALEHIWSGESLARPKPLPNLAYYLAAVFGLWGGVMLPGVVLLAGVAAWRRGGPERRFFLGVVGGTLLVYVPYFWQDDRFLFPVVALVSVMAGACVSDVVHRRSFPSVDASPGAASV